ncbi:hypothetical protein DPMN_073428 [Dreissena polymorpha]|uniref:Uncharacterized protein n=1 Tax=Dreissena polymorpha TaxID=45954 RepID=A0A9D4BZ04_DREPO|nr:hypothetical protein DPMN_073428 [Dreissena polymorpha]
MIECQTVATRITSIRRRGIHKKLCSHIRLGPPVRVSRSILQAKPRKTSGIMTSLRTLNMNGRRVYNSAVPGSVSQSFF